MLDATTRVLSSELQRDVGRPRCGEPSLIASNPEHVDWDLYRLMNLWPREGQSFPVMALPTHSEPSVAPDVRPNVLFAGTSFSWHIADQMMRNGLFGSIHVYYYNYTDHDLRAGTSARVEPFSSAWRTQTSAANVYIVEIPETFMDWFGGTFIDELHAFTVLGK